MSENISSTFSRDRPATSTPGYSGPVRRALPWSSGRRRRPPLLAGEVVKPFALVVSAVTTYTVAITVPISAGGCALSVACTPMATPDKTGRDIARRRLAEICTEIAVSEDCEAYHTRNLLPDCLLCCLSFPNIAGAINVTQLGERSVKQHHVGCNKSQTATVVALDTNHANAFGIDAVEQFCPPYDQREIHDVFIVINEGSGGEHIARTVYAASEDDARQTHQENYADEPLVAVHQ